MARKKVGVGYGELDLLLCFHSMHLVKGLHLLAGPPGLGAMSWVELCHHLEAIAKDETVTYH